MFLATKIQAHLAPSLKGADGQPIPSWGFIQKTVQFQGKLLTSTFLQAAVAGPVRGIDFLRKLKVIVSPEISWRFSHIHVDLVGPLQDNNSFNYIFTIIDCMSKWMEAIPLRNVRGSMRKSFNFYMDFSLWSARNDHF